jgi:dynein heavy chain
MFLIRFLLTGGLTTSEIPANYSNWLSDKLWAEMCRLSEGFEPFHGLLDSFKEDQKLWHKIYDSSDPTSVPLPEPWATKLESFHKLLIMRSGETNSLLTF